MDAIVDFEPLPPFQDSAPAPDKVVQGQPRQQLWNVRSSSDGRFHVGEWASTVGAWRVSYTEYELCRLLEGVVRLRDAQGGERIYRAGESFVIEPGFCGIFEVMEPCRKLYAIYE